MTRAMTTENEGRVGTDPINFRDDRECVLAIHGCLAGMGHQGMAEARRYLAWWVEHRKARAETAEAALSAAESRAEEAERGEWPDAQWCDFEDRIAAFEEAVRGHRVLDVPETRKALRDAFRSLRSEVTLLTHKVITCGVAAEHPDPMLSRRAKDYGGKWDSPQAEAARKLRERAETAERALSEAREALRPFAEFVFGPGWGGHALRGRYGDTNVLCGYDGVGKMTGVDVNYSDFLRARDVFCRLAAAPAEGKETGPASTKEETADGR